MSAKAQGYDESLLEGFNADFAMPDKLIEISSNIGTTICCYLNLLYVIIK